MRTKTWLPALLAVCCALVSACVADDTLVRDTEADLATGWLHGNCLALDDAGVRAGSPVAVVRLGEVRSTRSMSMRRWNWVSALCKRPGVVH